jgi:uncharacterized membrane protein YkoI
MVRTHTLIALVVSASLFGLGACKSSHGHEADEHEAHEGHESAEAEEAEAHEGAEIAKPAISLSAAIATAQKSVPEGRFLKAEIESEEGKTICSVILSNGNGQREVNVDATSGAILATEDEQLEPECGQVLEAIAKDSAHAPVGAGQAIEAALAKAPGSWALYAGLSSRDGQLVYAVFLLDGKTPKLAEVSAADGKVQKINVVEEEEEDEEHEQHEAPAAKPK